CSRSSWITSASPKMWCHTLCGELLHSDKEAERNHIRSYAGVQREWVSKMPGTNKSGLNVRRITGGSWVRAARGIELASAQSAPYRSCVRLAQSKSCAAEAVEL